MLLCLDARYDGTDCTCANPNLSTAPIANMAHATRAEKPREL